MQREVELRDQAVEAIEKWIAEQDELEVERLDDHSWVVALAGEKKRTIGLFLSVGDRTLVAQAHFMRAPDENVAALYELLLKRHQRSYTLRFSVEESGDILLVGVVPLRAITIEEVDTLAGAVLTVADETFNAALRLGFEGYIEREQRWRERTGQGRNPIS